MSYLFHNLLHFSRLLHAAGLDVHAGRMPDVAAALSQIDIARRSDFYFTLRTLLIHRHQDLGPFDDAFRVFWRRPPGERSMTDLRALGERRRYGKPEVDFDLPAGESRDSGDDPAVRTLSEVVQRIAPMSYSAGEISRTKDFGQFTQHELAQANAMLDELDWEPGMRWTRRWVAGRGTAADFRRMIRTNMRYGGEPLENSARQRKKKKRGCGFCFGHHGTTGGFFPVVLSFFFTLAAP